MKTPVVVKNDYVVYFEDDCGFTFIHCDCMRWSKSVRKELKVDLDCLFKSYNKDVYAIHEIDDAKHEKFVGIFGFDYLKDFVGMDGKARQMFVRRT